MNRLKELPSINRRKFHQSNQWMLKNISIQNNPKLYLRLKINGIIPCLHFTSSEKWVPCQILTWKHRKILKNGRQKWNSCRSIATLPGRTGRQVFGFGRRSVDIRVKQNINGGIHLKIVHIYVYILYKVPTINYIVGTLEL